VYPAQDTGVIGMRIPLKVATRTTGKLPPKPVKVATLAK